VLENAELMQLLLPSLRADFAVLETYVYTPERPLECPITTFGGLSDHEASRDELEAWRDQTSAAFSLEMFPGDHFFVHSAQPLLLQALSRELHQYCEGY
jgi:medium-chain acyl-[acyl-carrier-protein] hydrolase